MVFILFIPYLFSNSRYPGATAAAIFLKEEIQDGQPSTFIYSANSGDSRSALMFPSSFFTHFQLTSRRNGSCIPLSVDHKPSLPDERNRIFESGGIVFAGRINGVLGVSRAMGDHAMKKFVISDPLVTETLVTPQDTHIVIACDGLWDVLTHSMVAEIVTASKTCQQVWFLPLLSVYVTPLHSLLGCSSSCLESTLTENNG